MNCFCLRLLGLGWLLKNIFLGNMGVGLEGLEWDIVLSMHWGQAEGQSFSDNNRPERGLVWTSEKKKSCGRDRHCLGRTGWDVVTPQCSSMVWSKQNTVGGLLWCIHRHTQLEFGSLSPSIPRMYAFIQNAKETYSTRPPLTCGIVKPYQKWPKLRENTWSI